MIRIVSLVLAPTVPHLWLRSSQPTPSFAVQLSVAALLLVNVIDLYVSVLPKSTSSGDTYVPDCVVTDSVMTSGAVAFPLESTSTGEELQAAAMAAHTMSIAARCARMTWGCT